MAEYPTFPKIGVPFPVPVLPTVFDESLSYYELLAKLWQQCNELTELVNAETAAVNSIISQFDGVIERITALETGQAAIAQNVETLTGQMQQLRTDLSALETRLYSEWNPVGDIVMTNIRLNNIEKGAIKTMLSSADLFTLSEGKYGVEAVDVHNIVHLPPTLASYINPSQVSDYPFALVIWIAQNGASAGGEAGRAIYVHAQAAGSDVIYFTQQLKSPVDPDVLVWDDWSIVTTEVDPNT